MDLAMVASAEGHGELIADFTAERWYLRKPQMMRVCRASAADQAWLFGDGFDVLPIADPTRDRQGQNRLVDGRFPNSTLPLPFPRFGFKGIRSVCRKSREP